MHKSERQEVIECTYQTWISLSFCEHRHGAMSSCGGQYVSRWAAVSTIIRAKNSRIFNIGVIVSFRFYPFRGTFPMNALITRLWTDEYINLWVIAWIWLCKLTIICMAVSWLQNELTGIFKNLSNFNYFVWSRLMVVNVSNNKTHLM